MAGRAEDAQRAESIHQLLPSCTLLCFCVVAIGFVDAGALFCCVWRFVDTLYCVFSFRAWRASAVRVQLGGVKRPPGIRCRHTHRRLSCGRVKTPSTNRGRFGVTRLVVLCSEHVLCLESSCVVPLLLFFVRAPAVGRKIKIAWSRFATRTDRVSRLTTDRCPSWWAKLGSCVRACRDEPFRGVP